MNDGRSKPLALDVRVPSEDMSYPVFVGSGLLGRLGAEVRRQRPEARMVVVISDDTVEELYGASARASLEEADFAVLVRTVPPGEASKRPAVMLHLIDELVAAGVGRQDVVVTLGGGVVGDLGGLVAALFMRGIGVVHVPTTLLAQVDASVGGKVAVDLDGGKNLLGAFHFPVAVVIDPDVLKTLPDRQLACGLAEMLKHGALFSRDYFEALVHDVESVYTRDVVLLSRLVATSVALKAACVSRDPLERGAAGKGRVALNLGHTVGHALEMASGYDLLHGEAVGLGLRAAARVSEAQGLAQPGLERTMTAALERLRLPFDLDPWLIGDRGRAVEAALKNDKKRSSGTLTYIGLTEIGEPRVISLAPEEILALLRA